MSLIGAKRLTPDVLPYDGYGMQSAGEYKATLAFLRAVDASGSWGAHRFLEAPVSSNEYRGAMAALRGGLVGDGKLTPYGREYLAQRS